MYVYIYIYISCLAVLTVHSVWLCRWLCRTQFYKILIEYTLNEIKNDVTFSFRIKEHI